MGSRVSVTAEESMWGGWNFAEISCCGVASLSLLDDALTAGLHPGDAGGTSSSSLPLLGGSRAPQTSCQIAAGGRAAAQQHGECSLQLTVTTQPVLRAVHQLVVLDVHMRTSLRNDLHGDDQIIQMADVGDNLDGGHSAAGVWCVGGQDKLQGVIQ